MPRPILKYIYTWLVVAESSTLGIIKARCVLLGGYANVLEDGDDCIKRKTLQPKSTYFRTFLTALSIHSFVYSR
jgi:hypothetical protein